MRLLDADVLVNLGWGEAMDELVHAKGIDAVVVTRCKDCRYFDCESFCHNLEIGGLQPNDYCSLAEREMEEFD